MSVWTKERDAELVKLREQGFSAAQIAVKLGGLTRSAVIGRADRMGLRSTKRAAQPRPAVQRPVRNTPFVPPATLLPVPAIDQQSEAPVALLDLEPHHCRWPVSEAHYLFCAATQLDGSSYCRRHFGISRRGVANQP